MPKQFTKKEIAKRRKYQREWRAKKIAAKSNGSNTNDTPVKRNPLTEIITAYQLLISHTKKEQLKTDLTNCVALILKGMD